MPACNEDGTSLMTFEAQEVATDRLNADLIRHAHCGKRFDGAGGSFSFLPMAAATDD